MKRIANIPMIAFSILFLPACSYEKWLKPRFAGTRPSFPLVFGAQAIRGPRLKTQNSR